LIAIYNAGKFYNFQRRNSARALNYVGKTDGPMTGIAPVGYAAGGLGGPGVNVN